jgi:hypothetical protein
MPNEPDYDPLIDEFKKSGQMPLLWQWTAREFVCSANILRNAAQNTSLFPDNKKNTDQLWKPKIAIWLLYGLALENLVKGLLVAQGIDATSTGKLNESLKTHDLVRLWRRAGLPVSDATDEILKNLHWSVEVGKYPVATKPEPDAPTPVWIALMNATAVVNLIEIAEDALRAKRPDWTFEKQSLLELCAG